MNDIDKWAAEQCGVEIDTHVNVLGYFRTSDMTIWTIKDARCREVFRSWWLSQHKNGSVEFYPSGNVAYRKGNSFGFLECGEIACITAIWEANSSSLTEEPQREPPG